MALRLCDWTGGFERMQDETVSLFFFQSYLQALSLYYMAMAMARVGLGFTQTNEKQL